MNHDSASPQDQELTRLLSLLCTGELSADEQTSLLDRLERDEALREQYVKYMNLHAELTWRFSETKIPAASSAMIAKSGRSPVLRGLGRIAGVLNRPVVYSVALVGILFYSLFALLATNLRPMFLPAVSDNVSASQVATVRDVKDVKWSTSTPPLAVDAPMPIGELLKIEAGEVELELHRGARVVVSGPASWSIDGENAVTLNVGKLAARVPHRAIGFTVGTPTVQIVDRGTEFGVDVDPQGQADIEVFQGKVDISYSSIPGSVQAPRIVRMQAGQAKQFSKRENGAEVTVVDVSPGMKNRLAKPAPIIAQKKSQPDAASQGYAAAILADHPLGYWRFSDGHREIAADASGNGHDGRYRGSLRTGEPSACSDRGDHSIRVLGPAAPGWVEIDNVELPASFTLELWARSATPTWNTHDWLLASPGETPIILNPYIGKRLWDFHLTVKSELRIFGVHEPDNIADHFHHYVAAYDTALDRAWQFFDGAQVNETANVLGEDRDLASGKHQFFIGRADDKDLSRCGDGWIDELAIYGRALSAEAVRRHYETAGHTPAIQSSP